MKSMRIIVLIIILAMTNSISAATITVSAAADLANAFKEISELYEKESKNKVNLIFSSSGTAKEQILNGAPYDVYASANIKFVDDLIKEKLIIPNTKELYGIGRIGIATSILGKIKVNGVNDLLSPNIKKIAIANPDHAPYGLAAKEALISLGIWDKIKDKIVYGKDIQDTLSLIKTGNADAGIIALSIANSKDIKFIIIDDKYHNPLKQAIAVVNGTKNEKESKDFIKFVNGKKGRIIMKKYGFVLPGEI